MRRNIFTSYIIGNRLNLKTFFEPIINFIEIGKPRTLLRTVYENFISYSSMNREGYVDFCFGPILFKFYIINFKTIKIHIATETCEAHHTIWTSCCSLCLKFFVINSMAQELNKLLSSKVQQEKENKKYLTIMATEFSNYTSSCNIPIINLSISATGT